MARMAPAGDFPPGSKNALPRTGVPHRAFALANGGSQERGGYSTVTLFARFRGWSISQPEFRAM